MSRYTVTKRIEVAGAHCLELDYESACQNLHGHNWIVEVTVEGDTLNENGMLMDFKHIKNIVMCLDHKNINDLVDCNPTAENICRWLAAGIDEALSQANEGTRVAKVSVQESEGNVACFTP